MKKLLIVIGILMLMTISSASAAIYVKIPEISGDATDKDHKDWIEIESFSWGAKREAKSSGSGRSSAKVEFNDYTFTSPISRATPKLMESMTTGKVFDKVEIHFTKSGHEEREVYLKWELHNTYITSYQVSGSVDDVPVEEFSLNYEKIKWTYSEPGKVGKEAIKGGWDIAKGVKI